MFFHVLVWLGSFSVLLSVPESRLLHSLLSQLFVMSSCCCVEFASVCLSSFFCSFHLLFHVCPLSISSPFLFDMGSPSVAHTGREHGVFLQITDKCHFLYNFFQALPGLHHTHGYAVCYIHLVQTIFKILFRLFSWTEKCFNPFLFL